MSDWLFTLIIIAVLCVNLMLKTRGVLPLKRYYLHQAVVWSLVTIYDVWQQRGMITYFDAGWTAMHLWLWWTNGGDDDTKRRLRSLKRAFSPVRRTAPSAA